MAINKDFKSNKPAESSAALIESPKAQICPRDERGRFKKGYSGNPHAWAVRKQSTPVAQLCREKGESWVGILDSIICDPAIESNVRVTAIKLGLEYGYGKPLQGSEARQNESRDYEAYVDHLTREIHKKFDFRNGDIVGREQEIKEFIAQKTENGDFLNKIYDDILKRAGSYSFQGYIDRLNEGNVYYKYID